MLKVPKRPISFRPSTPDIYAMHEIGNALSKRTKSPFVDRSAVIRLAIQTAARLAKEGRLFEHLDIAATKEQ